MTTIRKRFFFSFLTFLLLGFSSCASFDNLEQANYPQNCNYVQSYNCGSVSSSRTYYRSYPSNSRYRNTPGYYYRPSSNTGHNPFYVPSGRFHNVGRPSKWRL
ncbi:putative lipoprotein [Leptospira wolffii serovar Khorat str. Khorat-H2]|nr:putative lipoprotein [Leptospira wolffii serovar Khorat str. Khorat-H2]